MPVIEFADVSKTFSRATGRLLLRSHVRHWMKRSGKERFWALKHVSFQVEKGESLAVIGPNGAGKSTLLSLVAGLARPDGGSIRVDGRVAALLELGSGFHPDLTGAENVRMNAALLGLTRRRTEELFDEIVDFSGVGEFIHETLRTYSSGMVMRLAFAVASSMDPEVMLIDEVLAVGDQAFQARCLDKIHELRNRGRTLVVVSHSAALLERFCDQAVWLDHGELVMAGTVHETLETYAGNRAAAP
jgi:ABC-type polysaccharide/polyol phosphate transport system ATPase subunit